MNIEPIAYFRSPFTSKFGIPRQSGIVSGLRGTIVFTDDYRQAEALRGLDSYDYLWLIWGFSEHVDAEKHATVRPPLLGGNERMGVWATRSPFRPNNLGLSSVRIAAIDFRTPKIEVMGADLMDGTPIYDIKPYIPYADSVPDAASGFAPDEGRVLDVDFPDSLLAAVPAEKRAGLLSVLAHDPRPRYQDDPDRVYGMAFAGLDIRFRVNGGSLLVNEAVPLEIATEDSGLSSDNVTGRETGQNKQKS